MPYVKRLNRSLCVTKDDFDPAVKHYNKALVGLKMLSQIEKDSVVST